MTTWRDIARPIIADVINRVGVEDEKALKKALFDAYPFGERQYHPYKIWLDEIKIQRGFKTFGIRKQRIDPNQRGLFE